ncbi:MAG: OmpA family protein [Pseudomonadota bacterium]
MFSFKGLVLPAAVAVIGLASVASADPAYRADDVVKFFQDSASRGLTRGLCVGTAQECDREADKPPTFDMLVTFELGSDQLTAAARENLLEFAKALQDPRLSVARFAVEGHTDARGSEDFNLRLSLRRAETVIGFLEAQGLPRGRFNVKGFGETAPRTNDAFDPINRRVETRILLQ